MSKCCVAAKLSRGARPLLLLLAGLLRPLLPLSRLLLPRQLLHSECRLLLAKHIHLHIRADVQPSVLRAAEVEDCH